MIVQKTSSYVLQKNREHTKSTDEIMQTYFKILNYCSIMEMLVVPGLFLPFKDKKYILPDNPEFEELAKECMFAGFTWEKLKPLSREYIEIRCSGKAILTIYLPSEFNEHVLMYQSDKYKYVEDLAGLVEFSENAINKYRI